MNNLGYHIAIYNLIIQNNLSQLDTSFIQLDYTNTLKDECDQLEIRTEIIQDKIRLLTSSIKLNIYENVESFNKIREIPKDLNLLIINSNNPISLINKEVYLNFNKTTDYFLFSNAWSYLEFINYLKEQEKEIEDGFHFVDTFKRDYRKISFINLSDKGRLDVKYDNSIPQFNTNLNYSSGLKLFKACFEGNNNLLPKFLKSSLINIATNYPSNERFQKIFENLEEIVNNANINFEVYINNLSIDKIKKEYDGVKSKYFNELSDILSKLTQKILILPIGISALLFSIFKIKDEAIFLWIVLAVILITCFYLSILLHVNYKDLTYLKRISNNDYKILTENSFFAKFPEEKVLFDEIHTLITKRIHLLKIITESYFWIMTLSNLTMILIILYLIYHSSSILIIIGLILLIAISITRNNILNSNEEEEKNNIPN